MTMQGHDVALTLYDIFIKLLDHWRAALNCYLKVIILTVIFVPKHIQNISCKISDSSEYQ